MKKIIITGMPRSGTSWLGQIVNSDPCVAFRTEPLFSYKFKNLLNVKSSCKEVNDFSDSLLDVDDSFILQKANQSTGYYPTFEKGHPTTIAYKTTRHHELLEKYLDCLNGLNIVAIVRHPCGAINSWFKSYREFNKKGCQQSRDWRDGGCRNNEVGEYWGFDDWLKTTTLFVELSNSNKNFHLLKYGDLVAKPLDVVAELFTTLGIDLHPQSVDFLSNSHSRHDDDPYSVYKDISVVHRWKDELNPAIADEILEISRENGLSCFLD